GAALADVPGVRQSRGLRHLRARVVAAPGRPAGGPLRAEISGAVLRLRPRRGGPDRSRAADDAAQRPGDTSAAPPHHADPRHRGGETPLLRAPLLAGAYR